MSSTKDQEIIFQLRWQAKVLEKQAQKENKTALKERNLARRHLAKGERDFARLHAENSCRASQMAQFLAQQSSKVNGMMCDVRMAQIQAKQAKVLNAAVKEMEKHMNSMDLEKIAAVAIKYDQLRGKVGEAQALTAPTDEGVSLGSDALLMDLQNEIEQEEAVNLPTIPTAEPQAAKPEKVAAPMV